ncbi:hypothetical protein F975_02444 [Acinetobacter sp. ANC 3789]|uniref:hypothetical protein n=1 Tax=Acinetobacter sp. ANC 3789 TaxID=1217714 RepID=UPI0002CF0B68|nr:hypothetical protein [Acinetobacter sp. ANC 3789]ENU79815.1 hypothetical protein F975_02444 [Acinetobacter sp. ANC 3789]
MYGGGVVILLLLLLPFNYWVSKKIIKEKILIFNLIVFLNLFFYFYCLFLSDLVVDFLSVRFFNAKYPVSDEFPKASMMIAGLLEAFITTTIIHFIWKRLSFYKLIYVFLIAFFPAMTCIIVRWLLTRDL